MDTRDFRQSENVEDLRDQPGAIPEPNQPGIADTMGMGAQFFAEKAGIPSSVARHPFNPGARDLEQSAGIDDVGNSPDFGAAVNRALKQAREDHGLGSGNNGMAQNFADGGPVGETPPEEDMAYQGDTQDMGAIPVQSTGEEPLPQQPRQPGMLDRAKGAIDQSIAGSRERNSQFGGNVKRIMAYLMGSGAASPEDVQQITEEAGTGDNAAATVAAAEQAGGTKAAAGVVQHQRQKYDAGNAHAAGALAAGDLANAAKSATMAFKSLPDGYDVTFTPNPQGVFAQVKQGGKELYTIGLSPDAFNKLLRKDGQFDTILANDTLQTFQKLAAGAGQRQARPQAQGQAQGQAQQPQGMDLSSAQGIEAASNRMFPWVGQQRQRDAFIVEQLNKIGEAKSKFDVATASNESKERIQGSKAASYHDRYVTQAKDHLDQIKAKAEAAARNGVGDAKERARIAVAAINAAVLGGDADKMVELAKRFGFDPSAPRQAAPEAAPTKLNTGTPPAGMKVRWGTQNGIRGWQQVQ